MKPRVAEIKFVLPNNSTERSRCFKLLVEALPKTNTTVTEDSFQITPWAGNGFLPVITFQLQDVERSEFHVILNNGKRIADLTETFFSGQVSAESQKGVSLEDLIRATEGRLIQVDHAGIVIPKHVLDEDDRRELLNEVSEFSNLYRYPTGEPWPFILPATNEEFESRIVAFNVLRHPKFEFVFTDFSMPVTIQVDMETDMTRKELEEAFPEPFGVCFPGLEEYFRAVRIKTPWPGFVLRFDLRYREKPLSGFNSWTNGEWLVQEGGRILPSR